MADQPPQLLLAWRFVFVAMGTAAIVVAVGTVVGAAVTDPSAAFGQLFPPWLYCFYAFPLALVLYLPLCTIANVLIQPVLSQRWHVAAFAAAAVVHPSPAPGPDQR